MLTSVTKLNGCHVVNSQSLGIIISSATFRVEGVLVLKPRKSLPNQNYQGGSKQSENQSGGQKGKKSYQYQIVKTRSRSI